MPVLPLVGSISVIPGLILPSRSAASIIALAMRSLTLHSGFMFSSLARIVATHPSVSLRSCTSGVLPMHCVMSFLTVVGKLAVAMEHPSCSRIRNRSVLGCHWRLASVAPPIDKPWRRLYLSAANIPNPVKTGQRACVCSLLPTPYSLSQVHPAVINVPLENKYSDRAQQQ